MVIVFGVKTDDIETARVWIEKATGLTAEGRESSELGGDYYLFESSDEEELSVVNNVDLYDGEPILTSTPEWKVALRLEGTTKESPILRGLESAPDRFVKLKQKPS